MNTSAQNPAQPSRPFWRSPRHLLTCLAGILLTVFLYSPVTSVMDTQLDSSNYGSYTYFAAHHFQYGPQVVPMSGPYGYVMYGSVYNGMLFWKRLVFQLLCAGSFAALLLWFFHQCQTSGWRWLWLGLILLLSPVMEDLPYEWMILLVGLLLLRDPPSTNLRISTVLATALLAFISLIKGTHMILSVATLGVVIGYLGWFRGWRRAISITCVYALGFLLFWILAGQDPRNILSFLQGVKALTNGYNEAMALNESPEAFRLGIFCLAAFSASFGWTCWLRRNNPAVVAAALLFAGFTFVKWKHGFVRADGHVYILHHFAAVATVFWFLVVFAQHHQPVSRRSKMGAMALAGISLWAAFWTEDAKNSVLRIHWLARTWTVDHIDASVSQLLHPVQSKAKLDEELAQRRETFSMPLTRQEVGHHTIDLFGLQHGIIPLNELNYQPRPMGGGAFNAYNRYLMELNRDFIRDAGRRPDYYLLRFETIDNRLATEDDGPTLLALLQHYEPILVEQGHLLMKATATKNEVEPRLLARRTFKIGEFVPTPAVGPAELLVARFDAPLNLKGRLRSALYKPPLMFITLQGQGIEQPESRRFIPNMTAAPFLFGPVIENNSDLAYLYTQRLGKQLTGFFIYTEDESCYSPELTVEFFVVARPQVSAGRDIEELLAFTRFPIANVMPEAILPERQDQHVLRGLLVQKLHPPAEIMWKLEGTEYEFIFDYGFLPEAYERGTGNGVIFFVELRPPNGPTQIIFETLLDPVKQPKDRGNKTARITLPTIKPGTRIVIRTDPGEYGDNAWDWAYVTRMQIKRGYFNSVQYPVFSRTPDIIEAEHSANIDVDGGKVFMLNIPGSLGFNLAGPEQHLYLEFGVLPGAYTGQGRIDGALFIVELIRANEPPKTIFSRVLQPTTNYGDRGRQSADITIPGVHAGDRLVVSTRPIEGGSISWGWTYISRLTID